MKYTEIIFRRVNFEESIGDGLQAQKIFLFFTMGTVILEEESIGDGLEPKEI